MQKGLITTFYKAHNYGAMLQAYALKNILESNGYKIEFLNYKDKHIENGYKLFNLKNKSIKNKIKTIVKDIIFYRKHKKRICNFNRFQNEKLKETQYIIKENDFLNLKENFIITGSDQVWNPEITGGLSNIYTLNFCKNNIKKISYAASIGNEKNVSKHPKDYINKISKIDRISVREESAKEELKKILPDKKIEVVLAPTLLLTKKEWEKNINFSNKNEEKYILAYIVAKDSEHSKIVNELSKKTGLRVIHFENKKRYKKVLKSAYTEGPLEFINLIKNAEYVIATSFHATVFSIIFNKKFWIVPHKTTGSRVTDLLKKLVISNRAVNTIDEFNNKDYNEEIDYEKVNKLLEKERQKSIDWLMDAIEK